MRTNLSLRTWPILALCTALGCGGSSPSPSSPLPRKGSAPSTSEAKGDGLASLVATVPEGTLGPYVGYGPKGAMTLFSPPKESERRWLVQPLNDKGAPLPGPYDVGPSPEDVPFAVVRPIGDEFLAMWVRQVHRADVLEGIVVGLDGSIPGSITTLAQAQGHVVWADAMSTSQGTVLLWVEQMGERADLKRLMVNAKGAPVGQGDVLVRDVRAWETAKLDDGVAVALVAASEGDKTLGSVVLLVLDGAGKPKGPPTAVSQAGSARFDVGLVRARRSLLMAWTERGRADSLVYAAAADFQGRLMVSPRAPLAPLGDQALVALVEPSRAKPDQALLVYEELPSSTGTHRELRLSTLSGEAVASGERVRLAFSPVGQPNGDFGTTGDGFVLLTRAEACASDGACDQVPWYVRLGSSLAVDGAGPVVVGALGNEPPVVMWSPGCTSTTCLALAVGGHDPAPVVAARLPKGSVASNVPVDRMPVQTPPMPVTNRALHSSTEPVSAVDVASTGSTTFLGWVTHFTEGFGTTQRPPPGAPGDPTKPLAAQLGIQRVDASGKPVDPPTMVSVRALSAGGIALAPHPKADEVCVAWVARDAGDPQVFLTRIGSDGKSKLQRMITQARGDAADVAIAPHGEGWIVAWVDWRDGNGEVYVSRVGPMLVKLGPEKRITNAPGDASDVSLVVVGDDVFVAYGDSRDHVTHGTANPYVQRLKAASLDRVGEETRVDASELHTRGLQLSRAGQDVVIGWLTQALPGSGESSRPFARVSRLDPGSLRLVGAPGELRGSGEAPISLNLACDEERCRGAMTVPRSGGTDLVGFSWAPTGPRVQRGALGRATGPSAAGVNPAVLGDAVYYVDQGLEGDDRLRRVHVRWSE